MRGPNPDLLTGAWLGYALRAYVRFFGYGTTSKEGG